MKRSALVSKLEKYRGHKRDMVIEKNMRWEEKLYLNAFALARKGETLCSLANY